MISAAPVSSSLTEVIPKPLTSTGEPSAGAPESEAAYETGNETANESPREEDVSLDSDALVEGVVDVLYWLFAE